MLLNNLGVSFQWHIRKESKKLKYRDLTGSEKFKLFQYNYTNVNNSSYL